MVYYNIVSHGSVEEAIVAERFAALQIILFSSVTQKECVWFQAATKTVEAMKHVVHPNYRPPSRRTHFLQRFDEKLAWPDQVMIGVQIWAWCSPTYKHTHTMHQVQRIALATSNYII